MYYTNIKNFTIFLALAIILGSCSIQARLKKADKAYESGEFHSSAQQYNKAYASISTKTPKLKAETAYKIGESYRYIHNHRMATRYYNQAIRYKVKDSTVYLNNGLSYWGMGNYREAAKNFNIYLKTYPNNTIALKGIQSQAFSDSIKKNQTRYTVRTATEFNSRRNSDFSPSFMGSDSETIVFTSNRDNSKNKKASAVTGVATFDLFTSKKNAIGKWESVNPLEGAINSESDEGTPTLSADGKTIYFTRCQNINNQSFGGQIFSSVRSGGEWTEPKAIEIFKDSSITAAHPSISHDGNTLYFVSDYSYGSFGGKDIWRVTQDNGGWGNPENLGGAINTPGDELFPYIAKDGTLYFASDGHLGLGGLDLYKAEQDSLGKWTVTNMGVPFNTFADDFGITFEGEEQKGYFSSNRNQSKGYDRLYYFELPKLLLFVEGKVVDEQNEIISEATIRLVGSNGDNIKIKTKKDGTYNIKLSPDVEYIMLGSSRGYLNQNHRLSTATKNKNETLKVDFKLASVSKPVPIDDIFFVFGKAEISPNSAESLLALLKLLKENPNIAIELSAHTDYIGNNEDNKKLSTQRAEAIVNYLIGEGVEKDRLTSIGYGEEAPLVVTAAINKQYPFLQEGTVLNEDFIKSLPTAQQETVNQINRRMEFRVTKTTYKLY